MDTTDVELLRAGLARQIADADAWPTWRDKQKLEVFRELVSDKFTDEQIAHSYFKLPTGYGKTVMFADKAGFTQKRRVTRQSLLEGTKVVGAMSAVQDIENSTKPDDQHQI